MDKESKQQNSDFKKELRRLYISNSELEPQITTYMEQIEESFKELRFVEPTKIPDVFLKEFNDLT